MDGPTADVFVGVDMAKAEHYAQAITTGGVEVFSWPIINDQTDIEKMLDVASEHGDVAVVTDMTASGAQLLLPLRVECRWPMRQGCRCAERPSSTPGRRRRILGMHGSG